MKNKILILCLLCLAVGMTACKHKGNETQSIGEGTYQIYYVSDDGLGIVSESYQSISTEIEALAVELLEKMKDTTGEGNFQNRKGLEATVKELSITEGDRLLINFETDYYNNKGVMEVLTRACIVKTLTQIKSIDFIEFNVAGQPLVDTNEKLVGLMTKEDFIDDIEMETSYQITVYFANKEGTALVKSSKVIYDTGTSSMEQLVIKQLISGPTEDGMKATIPDGTTLLKATTKDGICYVDFNPNFMSKISDISEDVAIYSIVNSLVELPNVNKVQFMINGEVKKTYSENVAFDGFFERNLALIEGTN